MPQPVKVILTPLLLSLLLVVTACGSDSNGRDPDGTGGAATGGSNDGSGGTDPGSGGTNAGTGGSVSTCSADGNECGHGFECNDSGNEIECIDTDECATETDSCDENASCENTEGSHECTCDSGFEGDGEECTDIDECEEGLDDCDDDLYCINSEGSFSCDPCPAGYELDGDECVALVPQVVSSTPVQGAEGVYPSEFYLDPTPGRGIRERVYVHLTFNMEMNTGEATVVVTDEDGLEEPRIIEGTWDATGHIMTAIISPHNDDSAPALYDETTYNVSFAGLQSSFGAPVDPEDSEYPEAQLTFTTGVRVGVLNHACIHVFNGPYTSLTALAAPNFWAPTTDTPHYHYTITLPEAGAGEYAGYTSYFPNQTATYHFYAQNAGNVQLEMAILDEESFEPGPWMEIEVEIAPPACHSIRPVVMDPETEQPTLGSPEAGITHQYTLNLSDESFYLLRWTSPEDTVRMIVENAGSL